MKEVAKAKPKRMDQFVELILPLALNQNYTYRVPPALQNGLEVGMRVVAPLGKRKLYTGIVKEIHQREPKEFSPKDIVELIDQEPVLSRQQLDLWTWIADYYLCSEGEVMAAALPSGLKLESEMIVQRNLLKPIVDEELNDPEYLIVEALESQDRLSIKDISEITGFKNPLGTIKELLSKHYIVLEEELKHAYKPRKRRLVRAGAKLDEKDLQAAFGQLGRAEKQRQLLLSFFSLRSEEGTISAPKLLKKNGAAESSLKSLAKKGLLEIYYQEDQLNLQQSGQIQNLKTLNTAQAEAYEKLKAHKEKPSLLHGVTSSGKTEVYVQLMADTLRAGRQVLYLVPEIALTTQLITRLQAYFGTDLLVYHSRFSDRDRVEAWLKLKKLDQKPCVVIGARSSVFLPFQNLGLLIVDEEHENSFKQYEPSPRYHARDTALVLARQQNAQAVLGSATPSFESYFNVQKGKYQLVEMLERYGNLAMPRIKAINLKEMRHKKLMRGHFSQELVETIEATLKADRQIILFQNRRGFSTFLQCETCGHVVQCKNCDISLTYHRYQHRLRCHYCGYNTAPPQSCPACKSKQLKTLGFGTEKLEDDLKLMFPEARVQRMDLDTTRKKKAYENIIGAFEDGETDILVGTQMVTKGLDFENVGLVAIMNADTLIHFPDFRSHEKAFQMLSQVAGRAGRKGEQGLVLIQCSDPQHPVILDVIANRYQSTYRRELSERQEFRYPPYYRLIRISLKHRDRNNLEEKARNLGSELKRIYGWRMMGPEYPLANRLRGLYQMEILLKIELGLNLNKIKGGLKEACEDFQSRNRKQAIQIFFDVDPA